MPADSKIDKERRLIESTGSGVFALADCLDPQNRLFNDPSFDTTYSQLLDFSDVTRLDVTAADVGILVQAHLCSPKPRRSKYSTTEVGFGFARRFEVFRELAGETGIHVFRNLEQAIAWIHSTGGATWQFFGSWVVSWNFV